MTRQLQTETQKSSASLGAKSVGLWTARFLTSCVIAAIPALVSIINPHRPETAPIIMPAAMNNTGIVAAIAVPVMWLVGYRWSQALKQRVFVVGLALTGVSIVSLFTVAFMQPERSFFIVVVSQLSGTLAIPCVSLFGLLNRGDSDEK